MVKMKKKKSSHRNLKRDKHPQKFYGRNPKHLSPRKSCCVKKFPAKVIDTTVKAHHHEGLSEGLGGEA